MITTTTSNRVRQHLVHPGYFGRDAVIDGAFADLHDQTPQYIRLDFGHHLELLALAVFGFGDGGF